MNSFSNHILSIVLLTPIAGAVAILLVPRQRFAVIRGLASTCGAAAFLLSLPLWFLYDPHGKTWQFAERGEWMPFAGTSYYVGVDGFSLLLILLTTFLGFIATVATWNAVADRVRERCAALLILEAGMLGAFMALDFLLFFVCWQVMAAAMYFLIRGGRSDCGRGDSAARFLRYSASGSAAVLVGILILGFYSKAATGSWSFDITQFHVLTLPFDIQRWAFLAFLAGFAGAVPLIPFHGWLPDAQDDAPAGASMMLGAVALSMGAYGFIRFSVPILPDASRHFVPLVAALAIAGIVYGALKACLQTDWKRLVAYASVSHMGMVMLALFAITPQSMTAAAVLLLSRGLCTAALLLLAGILDDRARERQPSSAGLGGGPAGPGIRAAEMRGLARAIPAFAAIFLVMTLATAASPALSGSGGMLPMIDAVGAVSHWWAAVIAAGVVFGAAYMLRLYKRTMAGLFVTAAGAPVRDLTLREVVVLVPVVTVALWVALYPAPLVRQVETAVGRAMVRVNPSYGPILAQGSDCPTPAPPDPAGPPSIFVLTESCADGSEAAPKASDKPGERR